MSRDPARPGLSARRELGSRMVSTPDGAELWVSLLGDGEPAVALCDGVGCDGFAWKYLGPRLARRHRVVHFHYRGHGRSTLPSDPTRVGVELAAEDLRQVLDEAGVHGAVLLGHSMGVQVLLEFHRRYPGRVLGLVPICGSYGHPLDTFHDTGLAKRAFPFLCRAAERFPEATARLWRAVLENELALEVGRHAESSPWLLKREDFWPYFTHLSAMDPRDFLRTLASAARHTAWDHLPWIRVPTLVVAGERDRFTPMWLSQRMHAAIPGSELLVVPRASHCAPVEMPDLIGLRLDRFLDERVRPT